MITEIRGQVKVVFSLKRKTIYYNKLATYFNSFFFHNCNFIFIEVHTITCINIDVQLNDIDICIHTLM